MEGLEVLRSKWCVFVEYWSLIEGFSQFELIDESRSDAISNEGCDLIYELSHEKRKISREEEILVEAILYFSAVSSCLEEEESEGVSFVKESLLSCCESKADFLSYVVAVTSSLESCQIDFANVID